VFYIGYTTTSFRTHRALDTSWLSYHVMVYLSKCNVNETPHLNRIAHVQVCISFLIPHGKFMKYCPVISGNIASCNMFFYYGISSSQTHK
jgi:hypothetical protein